MFGILHHYDYSTGRVFFVYLCTLLLRRIAPTEPATVLEQEAEDEECVTVQSKHRYLPLACRPVRCLPDQNHENIIIRS